MFSLMMWVTLATGINFIAGFTGYMPFGYVAFYGIGTYVTAILVKVLGVSEYLAVPAAGLSGILLALLFAPTLRLNGIFFAIVSLSLAVVCQRLMSLLPEEITGGSHGLNLGVATDRTHGYYAMLIIMFVASAARVLPKIVFTVRTTSITFNVPSALESASHAPPSVKVPLPRI